LFLSFFAFFGVAQFLHLWFNYYSSLSHEDVISCGVVNEHNFILVEAVEPGVESCDSKFFFCVFFFCVFFQILGKLFALLALFVIEQKSILEHCSEWFSGQRVFQHTHLSEDQTCMG